MAKPSQTRDTVRGGIAYLLALVTLLHFIYPITLGGGAANALVYNVLYAGMFLAGIFVASDSRRNLIASVTTALLWLVCSVLYALDPGTLWKVLATYLALVPFQATIVWVLLRHIFAARQVGRDVLLAAVTVYILLAALFVPIYGVMEALAPGSFVDNGAGQAVFWQQFIYFSLTTLTTTGYGDILPVSPWARAVANVEQVVGVLYIATLLARLVGVYSRERS
jgi:hypothetical protein